MSRALFVSERASLLCTQAFVRRTQATYLHRRVAVRSCPFFVSRCPYGTKVDCVPTWHMGSYAHLISLCSTATQYTVSPRYRQVLRWC